MLFNSPRFDRPQQLSSSAAGLQPAAGPQQDGRLLRSPQRRGSRAGWSRLSAVATLATLVVAGVGGWSALNWQEDVDPTAGAMLTPVTRGQFVHQILERGELESAQNVEIRCEVKSQGSQRTTIIWIIEEGTYVQKGDKVVEFDASALKEQELQQRIVYEEANASYQQAELAYNSARFAVKEYAEGLFKQELMTVEAEITVAKEDLRRAEDYAKHSQQLARKGYVKRAQLEADQFAIVNARLILANAMEKKRVLETLTKDKQINELKSQVGTAQAQFNAAKANLQLEDQRLQNIRDQISKCIVSSPAAGQVVYANEFDRRGNAEVIIDEGVEIRERQVVIRLPDPRQMQVRVEVREGRVGLLRPGQKAIVQVKAIRGLQLAGEVTKIEPIPITHWGSSVKQYPLYIRIDEPPARLKPGMNADVMIVVNERSDSLFLPIQSVYNHQGQHYVCLRTQDGPVARPVQVGPNNEKHVVLLDGVQADQEVVMNPRPFLEDLLSEAPDEQSGPPSQSEEPNKQVARGEKSGWQRTRKAARGDRPSGSVAQGPNSTSPTNKSDRARSDTQADTQTDSAQASTPGRVRHLAQESREAS